jgi:putative transcriptional regulator
MKSHFPATIRLPLQSALETRHAIAHVRGVTCDTDGDMDLGGQILIAMPGMADPRFEHAVILVCAHSADGAMGLIINKPVPDLSFDSLIDQLSIPKGEAGREIRVHQGGPVERSRGFVLHSPDWQAGRATMQIAGQYGMTATLDILEALANGAGPSSALLALGYSGWGPGQLEAEIGRNDWLTANGSAELIFSQDDGGKWAGALRRMGIDPVALSATAGRA